jgi:hypothetical protein
VAVNITYFTAENTSTAPRAAQIGLGSGSALTLKQSGYPTISCQYSPSSETIRVGSSGANVNNVYAAVVIPQGHDGCIVYAATSKAPWISDIKPIPGDKSTQQRGRDCRSHITVAANSGPARSAIVRLGKGFALTVKQDAGN